MDAIDLSITFVNMHGRIKEGTRSMSPEFAASIIQTTSMLISQRRMRKGVQIAHRSTITSAGGQDDTAGCRAISATVEEVACR
jgi:hypothetical protein